MHGYIVHMFVYILDIGSEGICTYYFFFFHFSYLVTIYPVNAFHFTKSGIHIFLDKLQGQICE